jgi:hypothetical protein
MLAPMGHQDTQLYVSGRRGGEEKNPSLGCETFAGHQQRGHQQQKREQKVERRGKCYNN